MRSPAIRHAVRIRVTLVGPLPEIWREVVIDRELTLADLRAVVGALFEGQDCAHHLFTDSVDAPRWSRTRRRWGDRQTMIDLRDPTLIDEQTARIGPVLQGSHSLYYGHTCENGWLCEIEAFEDDMVPSTAARVQVMRGEGRTPLACSRLPYEHAVLVGVLGDPEHPLRETLRRQLERTVGPWARLDAGEFDVADAQHRIDAAGLGRPGVDAGPPSRVAGPLSSVVARLPRPARGGLERHLAASGLDLPSVVTTDEARAVTNALSWVITRAGDAGIRVIDGVADSTVVSAGAETLGCDEERVRRLIALAKRGRVLYTRGGLLRANKRALAAAQSPDELFSMLARQVVRDLAPADSGALFLLAIADGSLADPTIGTRRSVEALALMRGHSMSRRHGWWGSEYDRRDGCDQACDCPSSGAGTWHDIVSQAIRDAATDLAGEAKPLSLSFGEFSDDDLGFSRDWLPATRPHRSEIQPNRLATGPARQGVDDAALLAKLDELIELLSTFGLEKADDDTWVVPPILRELARESLRPTRVAAAWGSVDEHHAAHF